MEDELGNWVRLVGLGPAAAGGSIQKGYGSPCFFTVYCRLFSAILPLDRVAKGGCKQTNPSLQPL